MECRKEPTSGFLSCEFLASACARPFGSFLLDSTSVLDYNPYLTMILQTVMDLRIVSVVADSTKAIMERISLRDFGLLCFFEVEALTIVSHRPASHCDFYYLI